MNTEVHTRSDTFFRKYTDAPETLVSALSADVHSENSRANADVHSNVREKYQAPCWVNPVLQKKLCSTPTSTRKIYEIGKDLWEASGGLELGFEEFKRYVKKPEVSFLTPETQIHDIWKSYFPPDTICNSFTAQPWRGHTPKTLKCAHCEKLTYKRKVCIECSEAAKIVVKVIEFVL